MSDNTQNFRQSPLTAKAESLRIHFLTNEFSGWPVFSWRRIEAGKMSGGARRDRTDDLLLAKQALSQLSYGPEPVRPALAEATAGNLRGSKVGVPTEAALAAKVGGPGKI
jgi:hypothetical protein